MTSNGSTWIGLVVELLVVSKPHFDRSHLVHEHRSVCAFGESVRGNVSEDVTNPGTGRYQHLTATLPQLNYFT